MRLAQCDCCDRIVQWEPTDDSPPRWAEAEIVATFREEHAEIDESIGPKVCICEECVELLVEPETKGEDGELPEVIGDLLVTLLRAALKQDRVRALAKQAGAAE